ncbi:M50 family metallopeptidase [Brachybacterium sp. YJGR34]|uniref:M50 family metallopeptidase n=1 Tax=Brachybacterium sp. YJGR34 TaxID=2059911 RepID=UPI000E0CA36A|nr:M50 family metallopeptidase [Brachybacterium sp. YJGR34]
MKSPELRLGTLPPIRVSPGTLVTVLLLAVIMYPALSAGGRTDPGAAVLLAVGIGLFMIVSVLVHEVAHAVVARAFGGRVDHIALTLWGGHTQYRAGRMSALGSVLISLAGPASNALLALLATAAVPLTAPGGAAATFWSFSAWLNIALALFNLLPGLPMDGGRALESLLGAVLRDPLRGTRVTAWIGRAIAVAVVALPLWRIMRSGGAGSVSLLTLVWAMLIAGMLWQGASRALEGARVQQRVRALDAAALARPMRVVPPELPLAELDSGADYDDVLVLEAGGRSPGHLGRAHRIQAEAAAAVPAPRRAETPVSAVTGPMGEVVALPQTLRGDDLVSAMLSRPAPVYLVMGADGRPLGVIMSAEVNALLRGR